MVSRQVAIKFKKENETDPCTLAKNDAVYFFDTGMIEFKGVQLPSCEVVFKESERYKEKLEKEMSELYGSIKENLWEQKIFQDVISLLAKTADCMERFKVVPKEPINGIATITNQSIEHLCAAALKAYNKDEDYFHAVELLYGFIDILETIPQFDRLILDYLKGIADKYDFLLKAFQTSIDREVEEKAAAIFGEKFPTYNASKKGAGIYERLLAMGRKSKELTKRKSIWFSLIKKYQEEIRFTLYSGKK
jgi:hypothetical protein